jgi:hypothetical protein
MSTATKTRRKGLRLPKDDVLVSLSLPMKGWRKMLTTGEDRKTMDASHCGTFERRGVGETGKKLRECEI